MSQSEVIHSLNPLLQWLQQSSDTSIQSASDTSQLIPEMHLIEEQLNTANHKDTPGIDTSVTTFKHKKCAIQA